MNNFNWNNYIGEHMGTDNYLNVKCKEDGRLYELVSIDMLENESIGLYDDFMQDTDWYSKDDFMPLIKSISDLTDEEWLFVFCGDDISDISIEKYDNKIAISDDITLALINAFDIKRLFFDYCDQQILNRFYSLHVSLDYEELIRTEKAVRKP